MSIFDNYLPKPKTMIKRNIVFNLRYDAETGEFDVDSTFDVTLVAADGTQAERFSPRMALLGVTGPEKTQLEAFFQGKVDALLLDTGYTIEPEP
ncbi:MAG: hypothetical protein ACYTDW_08065 [Planctomycetota bacterium]|jgi:hypothetical protein